MTTPFPFVSGQVLTAAQLNDIQNLPISDKTASYVLIAGDETKRTMMNNAGATTITVNNSIFTVGDVIQVANKGVGACTITAGAGVTINSTGTLILAQYGGGYLLALSASTFTFFKLGGAAVSTLAVDFFLAGGGGGGGIRNASPNGGGGCGGGGFVTGSSILGKTTYAVKVGAGGSGAVDDSTGPNALNGTASSFVSSANGGGGGGSNSTRGNVGGSGGGGCGNAGPGGAGVSGEGNAGGAAGGTSGGGGGAGGTGGAGSGTTGGAGGAASTNSYTGSSISYSGGGGGGSVTGGAAGTNAGAGGSGGSGSNGTANRAGGGGGATGGSTSGGNGGSGQVVIRYLTADASGFTITTTGSPTTGTSGSYSFIQYTATGTLVIA